MLICIVDDSDTNLTLLELSLQRLDPSLRFAVFTDPLAALEACARDLPDVVLVDYMMPGIDGCTFIARFRALPGAEEIPVVLSTAATEREIKRRAIELGVTDFLPKPVVPHELKTRMRCMIALRRLTQRAG